METQGTAAKLAAFVKRRPWLLALAAKTLTGFKKAGYLLTMERGFRQAFHAEPLRKALEGYTAESDISDHLSLIFFHTIAQRPRLIVELGTRGGESTRSLLAAAAVVDARMLSVDLADCSGLDLDHKERWSFVRSDDVVFGRHGFPDWARDKGLAPEIDLLFLDTSHEYEHTRQELDAWLPRLAVNGTVLLHDTNMGKGAYARLDGTVGLGWDNRRGVIRALEEKLGRRYREDRFFTDVAGGYAVYHFPNCNGLTVLKRLPGA